jgi:hypothetical protein
MPMHLRLFTVPALNRPGFFTLTSVKKLGYVFALTCASLILAGILISTNGSLFVGGAFVGLLVIVAITFYRADWGFNIFVFMVFFFDLYEIPGFPTFTFDVNYFSNLNGISYLPKFEQGVVTPMELQFVLIFFVWVLAAALRKDVHLTQVPLKFLAGLFFLAVIASIANGMSRGGDFIVALWGTRAFFYMGILFLFVPQIIKTKEQLVTLIWFCIAGISFKAFQGAIRYASLGFSFGYWPNIYETLTNHEDAVFFITLFILLISLSLFGGNTSQKRALKWLLVPLFLGYVAAQRRATYASFMAAMIGVVVLLPSREKRIILRVLVVFSVVFGAYVGVFWNSYSRIGYVAQQFKSTVTEEQGVRGAKDVQSTMYRKIEDYNLSITFRSSPILGIGYGKAFDRVLKMWGSGFANGDFIAHNQILWLFVVMGALGGFFFWMFFNAFVFKATCVFVHLADPYLQAICVVCIVSVFNQFVVSYVDMQLTWYRNMVHLGVLMGIVPVIESLGKKTTPSKQTSEAFK